MQSLLEWYRKEKERYKTNLSGIEKGLNLPQNSLHDFLNKGYVSEKSYPILLRYALEHGFKFQANQSGFTIDDDVCEISILQILENEYVEYSNSFLIYQAWKDYDEQWKAGKQKANSLPAPKKRKVQKL